MSWLTQFFSREQLLKLTAGQPLFILCAMICGFCIMGDYGIIRPVSHSIFLSAYGSNYFPYVWLAIVPFNFLIIELYNRFLPKIGIYKMFYTILALIFLFNITASLFILKIPSFAFFFYIWKEIYVMLLFQQLWSVIHSTVQVKEAKYLYGIIFGCGGLGGILGNAFPGYCAVHLGSHNVLLGSLPLLLILGCSFYYLVKHSKIKDNAQETQINNFSQGVKAIRNSKYLMFILTIVVLMQVITTLIYYQFNTSLESTILLQDARTEYCGRVFGLANVFSLSMQLFGTFLLIHFLGVKRSHFAMPIFLAFNALGSLFFPTFAMISAAFVTIKAFDFSLFGVLKEMLYIPLKQEEKFQAKAIIDVFAFRSSKAVASCLILLLQFIGLTDMVQTLSWGSFVLVLFWAFIVYRMFQLKTVEKYPAPSLQEGDEGK